MTEKGKNFTEFVRKGVYSEAIFKTEHLGSYGFIKKETLPKAFYYELCKV